MLIVSHSPKQSHFADAKVYIDEEMVYEAFLMKIQSTGKAMPE